MGQPYASILIPTRDPGPVISAVLESVCAQQSDFAYEVLIVDSGSAESDLARMRRFPVHLSAIAPAEFRHGRTRNLLASRARGEMLLFLSQDAEPASTDWMRTLVEPLRQARVAGAYARQIPRPDADPLMRFFLDETYGPRPARRLFARGDRLEISDMFFSNVSSAIRREVWQNIPFRDDVLMSEDQYWACDALRAGYELAYQPTARVLHSHHYSLVALFRRNRLSGRSLAGLIADSPTRIVWRGVHYVAREVASLARQGRLDLVPYMLLYELVKSVGFAWGSLEGTPQRHVSNVGEPA